MLASYNITKYFNKITAIKDVRFMVMLKSKQALKGWKYPIYTYVLNKQIIDALVNAGVDRELIKEADPHEMQVFDFLADVSTSTPMNPVNLDIVRISIVTKIEQNGGGVGTEASEVVSIPLILQ